MAMAGQAVAGVEEERTMEKDSSQVHTRDDLPAFRRLLRAESPAEAEAEAEAALSLCPDSERFSMAVAWNVVRAWVKQPSPCCAAAAVAGAWNALFGVVEGPGPEQEQGSQGGLGLRDGGLGVQRVLQVYQALLREQRRAAREQFERKLGWYGDGEDPGNQDSVEALIAAVEEKVAAEGMSFGGKKDTNPPKKVLLRMVRQVVMERSVWPVPEQRCVDDGNADAVDDVVAEIGGAGGAGPGGLQQNACTADPASGKMLQQPSVFQLLRELYEEEAERKRALQGVDNNDEEAEDEDEDEVEDEDEDEEEEAGEDRGNKERKEGDEEDNDTEATGDEAEGERHHTSKLSTKSSGRRSKSAPVTPRGSHDVPVEGGATGVENEASEARAATEEQEAEHQGGVLLVVDWDTGNSKSKGKGKGGKNKLKARQARKRQALETRLSGRANPRKSSASVAPCPAPTAGDDAAVPEDHTPLPPQQQEGAQADDTATAEGAVAQEEQPAVPPAPVWRWKTDMLGILRKHAGLAKLSATRARTAPIGNWGIIAAVRRLSEEHNGPLPIQARLLMGKGKGRSSKVEIPLSRSDSEDDIARQWGALRSAFLHPNTVLLFHLKNHYALVFAMREWQELVAQDGQSDDSNNNTKTGMDKENAGEHATEEALLNIPPNPTSGIVPGSALPARRWVRQILTARRGQRPAVWIDFEEARNTMLGWGGYKMMAIAPVQPRKR